MKLTKQDRVVLWVTMHINEKKLAGSYLALEVLIRFDL